ncbi:HK97-gp10 family putative phage morphogenesis protein [Sediminibacillus halophilus]|uniref:Phage protein, HK97 gp10 family n=1 Tax=Sediminibacillus halophilus TaxID=482461 RepID=A0A1G9QUX6_9BACI|nr:HK97-gp10 family putative phage morphogenesis protein [Sediminibacillus halophilus]SDM14753.1 phage protein, HK97 gp10 family [Sediminibacillus halophilus]
MSVKITGTDKVLAEVEKKFGKENMQRISDKALTDGAKVFIKELKAEFEKFKDKGYSIEEITISKPMWVEGTRTVKVYWRGPHDRYRIIHLNEWGTVQNPNPAGKGAIARAMKNAKAAYRKTIINAIRRGL